MSSEPFEAEAEPLETPASPSSPSPPSPVIEREHEREEEGEEASPSTPLSVSASVSATHAHTQAHTQTHTQTQTQSLVREVFIGDLSYYCTEQHLFQLFSQCGHVEKLRIRRSADGLHSLMHGFATMRAHHEALEVVRRFNNLMFIGRCMRVQLISPDCTTPSARPHRDGVQLHVSFISHQNVDCIVTEEVLRGLFEHFGRILDVTICRNNIIRNPPKQGGYGFVKMENAYAAQLAHQHLAHFRWNDITFDSVFSHSSVQSTDSGDASVESSAALTAAEEASSPATPVETRRTSLRQGGGRQQASFQGRGNRHRSIETPTQQAPAHSLPHDFSWRPHNAPHLQNVPPSPLAPIYVTPMPARWSPAPHMAHNGAFSPSPALGQMVAPAMQGMRQFDGMMAPQMQSFPTGTQAFNFSFTHIPPGRVGSHSQPQTDPANGSNMETPNAEGSVIRYAVPRIPQNQSQHANQHGVTYLSLPPTRLQEQTLTGNMHAGANAGMPMLNFPLLSPPTPVPIASPRNQIQYYWSVDHSGAVPVSPRDAVLFAPSPATPGGYYMAPQQQGGAFSAFHFPSEHQS